VQIAAVAGSKTTAFDGFASQLIHGTSFFALCTTTSVMISSEAQSDRRATAND
jgi:hypothetical protein